MSSFAHLLVVVYTYREPDVIRIISAWRVNRAQRLAMKKTAVEPYRVIDLSVTTICGTP
jgi:hypothetical protein